MDCKSCGSANEDWSTECWMCGNALTPIKEKPPVIRKPKDITTKEFAELTKGSIKSDIKQTTSTKLILGMAITTFILFFCLLAALGAYYADKPIDRFLAKGDNLVETIQPSALFALVILFIMLLHRKYHWVIYTSRDWLVITKKGSLLYKISVDKLLKLELGILGQRGRCDYMLIESWDGDSHLIEIQSCKAFVPYFDSTFQRLGIKHTKKTIGALGRVINPLNYFRYSFPCTVYEFSNK